MEEESKLLSESQFVNLVKLKSDEVCDILLNQTDLGLANQT
jgi:hypothetical protein